MENIVIVNAYGHSNRGDSVLLDECLNEIRARYPAAKINVVLFDENGFEPKPGITFSQRICNVNGTKNRISSTFLKIYYLLIALLYGVSQSKFFSSCLPQEQRETIKYLEDSDLVISSPGGYIHDTNSAFFIALLHLYLPIKMGKPVILAPQSIGPIGGAVSRLITNRVLNKVQHICSREGYSTKFLRELGVKESIIQASGDSAFWNLETSNDFLENDLAEIGIRDSEQFLGMTLVNWTFPNLAEPEKLKQGYIDAVVELIQFVHQEYGMRTVIFNQVSDDLVLSKMVVKRCEEIVLLDTIDKGPSRLRALIAQSAVFVGTRFHSCIFALMADVPTNAISYLPKTEYILRDLNLSDRFIDIASVDGQSLISKVSRDIENLPDSREQIRSAVKSYRKEKKRLGDVL